MGTEDWGTFLAPPDSIESLMNSVRGGWNPAGRSDL